MQTKPLIHSSRALGVWTATCIQMQGKNLQMHSAIGKDEEESKVFIEPCSAARKREPRQMGLDLNLR